MAQNVGTPRFYVSVLQWLDAMGLMEYKEEAIFLSGKNAQQLVHINPASQGIITTSNPNARPYIEFIMHYNTYKRIMPDANNFSMLLGHNLSHTSTMHQDDGGYRQTWAAFQTKSHWDAGYDTWFAGSNNDTSPTFQNHGTFTHDGFSIAHGIGGGDAHLANSAHIRLMFDRLDSDFQYKIGSILYGTFYDMPHSPDLSLKMSIEMDGVKSITTKGGSTLSNASYTKPPDWGDMGAWQVGGLYNVRHGRRSWDLSFSYLSDTDSMATVAGSTNITTDFYDSHYDSQETNTLRLGSDFFSLVWNRTMGGHLPFVFQPNNSDDTYDQFAICRFDMDSLQYDQVANNVYNVKLKIRECW